MPLLKPYRNTPVSLFAFDCNLCAPVQSNAKRDTGVFLYGLRRGIASHLL